MRTQKSFVALLLVLGLAFPPSLFAQGGTKQSAKPRTPSLGVADLSISESDVPYRRAIRQALLKSFEEDRRVRVVPADSISKWRERERQAQKAGMPAEDLRDARQLLADGKKAYEKLNFKRAVQLLTESRKEFILNLPALRSNRDLIDAHLYLGVTYIALKDSKKGIEEFRRVVYLDPHRELSARNFSPSALEAFAKARQEVMSSEPILVKLVSDPSGADVYLNGRGIGKTPMEVRLQSGEYFVLMARSGSAPWYKPVTIQKRGEVVQAALEPDSGDMKWGYLFRVREGGDLHSADLGTVQEMAGSVGADLVFFGKLERLQEYRLLGQLYDSRTSNLSKVAVVNAGPEIESVVSAAPDLADALLNFVRPDGKLATEEAPDLGIPSQGLTVGGADRPAQQATNVTPVAPKAWYEKWWIYPIIAGVGVGIFFGARQLGGSGGSKVVIDNRGNF